MCHHHHHLLPPLEESVVPMKILKPTHSGTSLLVTCSLSLSVPGLPPNFKLPAWALTGKLTLPKMPTIQGSELFTAQEYLHGFFTFFFSFSFLSQLNPTWHSNVPPHLVPTIHFCAPMYTLYVSHYKLKKNFLFVENCFISTFIIIVPLQNLLAHWNFLYQFFLLLIINTKQKKI
jgi:hypothetical protein